MFQNNSQRRQIQLLFALALLSSSSNLFAQQAGEKPAVESRELDPFEDLNREFLEQEKGVEIKPEAQPKPAEPLRPWTPPKREPDPEDQSPSRLSDKAIGLQTESMPKRPTPLLELGNSFLGTGPISLGFELPTGGVWQPSLLIYGNLRTGFNAFTRNRVGGTGLETVAEWANALEIFANLQLAGFANERIVFGMRPLDQAINGGGFSGYNFEPDSEDGEVNEFSDRVTTLFFEGDLGEVLPALDWRDSLSLDFGFAVGRQPISFQQGILINDVVDAVGLTRNTIQVPWGSNLRLATIFAWNQIHRGATFDRDDSAELLGLFTTTDLTNTTIDLDAVYVFADKDRGEALYGAASATQRFFGSFSTTLRAAFSLPTRDQTIEATRGALLVLESSWTPTGTEDNLFVNAYWGIDRFSSAARAPSTGGPLARVGILYAAVGLGRYPSALSNDPARSAGGSIGYQAFFGTTTRQLIIELGGRQDTSGRNRGEAAIGARFQQAFWQQFILRFDAFVAQRERQREMTGVHAELQVQF